MTPDFSLPKSRMSALDGTLVDAARCWRAARDLGQPVQPTLFRLLRRSGDMLAPVFDSLLTLYEAALGRPVVVGQTGRWSPDEHRLVGLFNGSRRLRSTLACAEDAASALECAISSTRVMLGRASQDRPV